MKAKAFLKKILALGLALILVLPACLCAGAAA